MLKQILTGLKLPVYKTSRCRKMLAKIPEFQNIGFDEK